MHRCSVRQVAILLASMVLPTPGVPLSGDHEDCGCTASKKRDHAPLLCLLYSAGRETTQGSPQRMSASLSSRPEPVGSGGLGARASSASQAPPAGLSTWDGWLAGLLIVVITTILIGPLVVGDLR